MNLFATRIDILDTDLFDGFSDLHSHILPCVDDGVQSIEEALSVLEWYERLGVRRVIFTPHIMESYRSNNAESLRTEFAKFRAIYSGDIELALAAEYMLDAKFNEHLESGDMLTLWDNYLLVECSYLLAPICFFETLQDIMSRGYFVVLAHPERYLFLSMEEYANLKQMGVMFQLNMLSMVGGYGREVANRAESLLKASYYEFVGSDIHNIKYYQRALNGSKLSKKRLRQIRDIINRQSISFVE